MISNIVAYIKSRIALLSVQDSDSYNELSFSALSRVSKIVIMESGEVTVDRVWE